MPKASTKNPWAVYGKGKIKKAIGKPGALHKATGTPAGKTIPKAKLLALAKSGNKAARLAYTLNKNK